MTTTFVTLNLILALTSTGTVGAMLHVSRKLPSFVPDSDETWGADAAWVASDPLPFRQLADHERQHEIARAA